MDIVLSKTDVKCAYLRFLMYKFSYVSLVSLRENSFFIVVVQRNTAGLIYGRRNYIQHFYSSPLHKIHPTQREKK